MTRQEIIFKALQKSAGLDDAARAGIIEAYLEIASDISGPALQPVVRMQTFEPPQPVEKSRLVAVSDAYREPVPEPIRVDADVKDRKYRTVDKIRQYLEDAAPSKLDILMPDGSTMTVHRKLESNEMFNLVKATYSPIGGAEGPAALFSCYDRDLNLDEKLNEVAAAAAGMFSSKRREIQPTIAPPVPFSLQTSIGVDDDNTLVEGALEAAQKFSANRTPEELAFIQGRAF